MGSSIEKFLVKDKRAGRDAVPNRLRRAPKSLLTQLTVFGVVGGAELRRDAGTGSCGSLEGVEPLRPRR